MEVGQPAAKMLVELSKSQDIVIELIEDIVSSLDIEQVAD